MTRRDPTYLEVVEGYTRLLYDVLDFDDTAVITEAAGKYTRRVMERNDVKAKIAEAEALDGLGN